MLLCSGATVLVGSCRGECQPIRVTSPVHADATRGPWMRAMKRPVRWVHRSPMRSTPSVALTASRGVRTRFTGRLVIVTGATVSTTLLRNIAVGDWALVRRCRSSMLLLRMAATPHCPVVSSVCLCCSYLDAPCPSLPRLMWLDLALVPCSPPVLSCGSWSMDAGAAVSAQRAAAADDCVSSLSW